MIRFKKRMSEAHRVHYEKILHTRENKTVCRTDTGYYVEIVQPNTSRINFQRDIYTNPTNKLEYR